MCIYNHSHTRTHSLTQPSGLWGKRMLKQLETHLRASMPRVEQPEWAEGDEVRVGPNCMLFMLST